MRLPMVSLIKGGLISKNMAILASIHLVLHILGSKGYEERTESLA